MSILLDPPPLTRRSTPASAAAWCIGVGCLVFVLTPLAVGLWFQWQAPVPAGSDPATATVWVRRLMAVLAIPWGLKHIGWSGIRDVGWTSRQTRGERKRDMLVWFGRGLLLLLILFGRDYFQGRLDLSKLQIWPLIWFGLMVGLFITVMMETFWRGMVYRNLVEVWDPWLTAGVVSILAAWVHQVGPAGADLRFGVLAFVGDSLFAGFREPGAWFVFVNQAVLGFLLCRMVHQRKDIWAAAGFSLALHLGQVFSDQGEMTGLKERFLFTLCLLAAWGVLEWESRYKMTSYGRVHF